MSRFDALSYVVGRRRRGRGGRFDPSTVHTAADIKRALRAGYDLSPLIGAPIYCDWRDTVLTWDVADYDETERAVTLLLHDTLPNHMAFEPSQALAYFENGLVAGNYTFKQNNVTYYFTLTTAIPAGGQLKANISSFQTFESQAATTTLESGTVSTTEIDGATDLGTTGAGQLNHHDRVGFGSNNYGESGVLQWLNSDAPANTPMPRISKFSRPYQVGQAGFLNGLDPEFLACIADTAWKCSANNVYECPAEFGGLSIKGQAYTVTYKFGLLSEMEVFGSYGGVQDGSKMLDLFVGASADDRKRYYNGTARNWWLRSPRWNYAHSERFVNASGVANYDPANYAYGLVPACRITAD